MYKIYIDLTWYQKRNIGFNNYIINLMKGFNKLKKKNFEIYLGINSKDKQDLKKIFNNKKIKFFDHAYNTNFGRFFWHHTIGIRLNNQFDIFLFTANFLPFFFPKNSFLVVHDLNYKKNTKDFSFFSLIYRFLFQKYSISNAKKVISISHKTYTEIKKYFNRKSTIINNPVLPFKTIGKKQKLILCASSLKKYKNIQAAYKACAEFINLKPFYKIIFIGNWSINEFFKLNKKNDRISVLGFQDDNNRTKLFKKAEIVLAPSKYEGFGLPYVEAIISQKKLVCCDIDITREIIGDKAFLIKRPFAYKQILSTLMIASEKKNLYSKKFSVVLANKYSPKKIASEYFDCLTK